MENKTRIVASMLGTLSLTDEGKKLSNMIYVEDQSCATAFQRLLNLQNTDIRRWIGCHI